MDMSGSILYATCLLVLSLHFTMLPAYNVNNCANRNEKLTEVKYRHDENSTTNVIFGIIKTNSTSAKNNLSNPLEVRIDMEARGVEWEGLENISRKMGKHHQGRASGNKVVVALDGSGNYKSIGEAIKAATSRRGKGRFEIYVKKGTYHEYVHIPSSLNDLTMVGDGIGATIIIGNKYAGQPRVDTFSSATFVNEGSGFIAKGITIRNIAGRVGQAVALRSHSNHTVFYQCSFESYQDTVYLYPGHQFFRECDIYGSMDMICGDATAVFQNCNIFLRRHSNNEVVITAQKRSRHDNSGFVIQKSKVMQSHELKLLHNNMIFLGRPWGKFSRTVFMQTYLDRVYRQGWKSMGGNKDGDLVYYAEFGNTGPGSSTSARIKWKGVKVISRNEASQFTVRIFLHGQTWLPGTGVPYDLDL